MTFLEPNGIEQRIGRVDRIGQKYPVIASNMLPTTLLIAGFTRLSLKKLDAILQELGIEKNDVLDSTIDMKNVNHLYLQSLLDQEDSNLQ